MLLKYSEGQKKRWAKVPKKKLSKMMSEVVSHRYKKLSKIGRKKLGKQLALARKKKKKVV